MVVAEEVEGPAGRVAEEVWGQAAVEGGWAAFVLEDVSDYAEGAAEARWGCSVH